MSDPLAEAVSSAQELADAFLAYLDTQLLVQRAEEDYGAANKEIQRPLIEAKVANKAARDRLATLMQARGLQQIRL